MGCPAMIEVRSAASTMSNDDRGALCGARPKLPCMIRCPDVGLMPVYCRAQVRCCGFANAGVSVVCSGFVLVPEGTVRVFCSLHFAFTVKQIFHSQREWDSKCTEGLA